MKLASKSEINQLSERIILTLNMLINIENTNELNLQKLIAFAKAHEMKLSFIDDEKNNYWLPGRPLTDEELTSIIEKSRISGKISMEDAHSIIRKNKNES